MSFVTLNTGLSGLRAAQSAIDITSNNIANVATEGYTRQRVELQQRLPYDAPVGEVGTGVEVDSVVRLRDTFLDTRVRTTAAEFFRNDTRTGLLERVEQVLAEPDDGVSVELDELWASFEDLALDPDSQAVRVMALAQLEAVAGRVRDVGVGIQQLTAQTEGARDEQVSEAQDLMTAIADMNRLLANSPRDEPQLDLQDKRDLATDRLAELFGAETTLNADGSATVRVAGQDLVNGFTAATVGITANQLTVDGTAIALADTRGELGGTLQTLVDEYPSVVAGLDDVIAQLTTSVNAQHAAGFTDGGTAGGALLSYTPGTLTSFAVLTDDPADLALRGGLGTGTNDNRNAIALADLRIADRGDGQTHDEALRSTVVELGARVASSRRATVATAEIANAADVARRSQHSVSLDEEMVSLVQYQRALEANSRIMTAADQVLDTIINRMGAVGR